MSCDKKFPRVATDFSYRVSSEEIIPSVPVLHLTVTPNQYRLKNWTHLQQKKWTLIKNVVTKDINLKQLMKKLNIWLIHESSVPGNKTYWLLNEKQHVTELIKNIVRLQTKDIYN